MWDYTAVSSDTEDYRPPGPLLCRWWDRALMRPRRFWVGKWFPSSFWSPYFNVLLILQLEAELTQWCLVSFQRPTHTIIVIPSPGWKDMQRAIIIDCSHLRQPRPSSRADWYLASVRDFPNSSQHNCLSRNDRLWDLGSRTGNPFKRC